MKKKNNEEKQEKELYQIDNFWNDKAIPIDWNKLPEDAIAKLKDYQFQNVISYVRKDKDIILKTVVYFRKVKKFRKNITQFEGNNNIIFGV